MNNLPEELFHHIFNYLDLIDLSNCKLVNKQFYNNLKFYRFKELNINFGYDRNMIDDQPINPNRILKKEYLFKSELFFNFDFLKRLQITIDYYDEDDHPLKCVNFIKKLSKNLEKLEIDNWTRIYPTSLDLPKLKVLCFRDEGELNLEITAPNLEAISIYSQDEFLKIKDPLSVKYLHQFYYNLQNALIFKNLESLSFRFDLKKELPLVLSSFPKLKKIMCEPTSYKENILVEIINERSKLKSTTMIYCNGLQIRELNDLNISNVSRFGDLMNKNYDQIGFNRELIRDMNYIEFIKWLKSRKNLLDLMKFEYIDSINVIGRVEDQDALIKFIKKCFNSTEFYSKNSKLKQNFYDQLPSISSLKYLNIYEDEHELDQPLKFDFVRKIFNLESFRTNQQLDLNENFELNRFKCLEEIEFKINSNKIKLEKQNNDLYKFYLNEKLKPEIFKLDQVIKRCKKFKKRTIVYETRSRSKKRICKN